MVSLKVDASISNQLTETDNSPDESRDVSMTSRVPRPASHPLEAHGISRSQESAVVTQMFSTYITSSDEQRLQQQYNSSNPAGNTPASNPSQTHARNASNESASLPQSHDYETVQGILPHDIPPLHTSPGQPGPQEYASPTISNRSVKATTPLQVGIAFGTLPNVSSSSGTSASSSNPFAGLSDHGDTPTAVGPIDSPSSSKKNVDKPLRFGFGGK
ncbi:hypothetical protein QFC19_002301 [Naganishia cerealis]|uniref:Uncharacterized protein n=1 Tax=Naganishia cerealis TaxID=610337 RepID=A0ACC2WBV2_9TREE|nr:hypothetical protein QFC19_002301 [Naganishia cerealis]